MSYPRNLNGQSSQPTVNLVERIAGTIPATLIQMVLLHPLDTLAKRAVKNDSSERIASIAQFNKIAFLDKYKEPFLNRYFSLYGGFKNGLKYKLLQTAYRFSFQPEVANFIKKNKTDKFLQQFLPANLIYPFEQAIAGAITGAFEVIILPLDLAKIKQQNNSDLNTKKLSYLIGQEIKENGLKGSYKGAGITIARNIPGSAALFCFPALFYQYILRRDKHNTSTIEQTIANTFGAASSLLFSNPQDVIKIRKQSEFVNKSSFKIAKDIIIKEGYRAFLKGFPIKCATQIPKLTLVATLADSTTDKIQKYGFFAKRSLSTTQKDEINNSLQKDKQSKKNYKR